METNMPIQIIEEKVIQAASEGMDEFIKVFTDAYICLLYTSPSPRDRTRSRMPSSA